MGIVTDMEKYFLLLQVNDSQFPIGSYTQSYGLESYVQRGLVTDGDSSKAWIQAQVYNALLYSELLPLKIAFSLGNQPEKLRELEELSLASRTARELREASCKLGKRFVRTVQGLGIGTLQDFSNYVHCCDSVSHPIAYGVFCHSLDIPLEQALSHYLYSQVAAFVTNAVKLVPLSQTEGQKILFQVQEDFPKVLAELNHLTEEQLFLSTVGGDIRSMEHEQLYSRLYMS